jgi:hypothetical protein
MAKKKELDIVADEIADMIKDSPAEPVQEQLTGRVALIRKSVTIYRDASEIAEYKRKGWEVK